MTEPDHSSDAAGADFDGTDYGAFEKFIGAIAGLALLAMMLLVFADVIGRYIFGIPIKGAYQLGSILLVVLLFASLPIVILKEAQLTVGFTEGQFHGRARKIQRFVINSLGAIVMGVLCWRLWAQGRYFIVYPEILEVLEIPLFLLCYLMAVLAGLAAAMHLVVVVRLFHRSGPGPESR